MHVIKIISHFSEQWSDVSSRASVSEANIKSVTWFVKSLNQYKPLGKSISLPVESDKFT